MEPNLGVNLAGLELHNPFVLASGIWGSAAETLIRAGQAGAGAVTSKSCSVVPRRGHPNPAVLPWRGGLINAVGLANPGAAEERLILRDTQRGLRPLGVPLIASIFGGTPDEYARAAELVAQAEPDIIEVNISCPNVQNEFGVPFALDPGAAAQVTAAVRAVYSGRLFIKLSPNTPAITAVARAAAQAGADGFTAVNTLGPGMLIDTHARMPILSNRIGGISGPALLPIALRCVYEITQALSLPVIGTGGIASGEAALQMVMAGATALGVGSALAGEGTAVFQRLSAELRTLMAAEGIAALSEVRGCAHG
ncbi:MAG: dihydroorotate dehydrogenase [Chloroflexi bacterium]|nr:dihydroorotate dehydrogenase [Chloroflexota bacterium]